ncbi:type II toxin-antitoxin system RelE/ParE family toxin [Falsiroseomonas stagni]|uniref:type II toxin-antitoxin system RelE/ParE family toxin n=1 Tax=Falsiroseomonas stagni TaxID=484882 RepID=UPI001587F821|nr:type II toxin-antitoxin system RelE/ParE family toxin [Falsiroseomonas stagni]
MIAPRALHAGGAAGPAGSAPVPHAGDGGRLDQARDFTSRLRQRGDEIASLSGTLGRVRADLGKDIRSLAWRDYVILFRYAGEEVEVIRIIHGQRVLPALLDADP